jgi:alpha-glucosidase (family GH31 glycosyl hydrolase)
MENGGGGEHRPWMYDEETLDIYRKYTVLHHELIPYIYSQAAYSYEIVKPTMRPLLGEYTYLFGDNILAAPIFEEGEERTIIFPEGEWIYMFDESVSYTAGIKKLSFTLDEFPAFIRKGAIIPMDVNSSLTGFGTALSKDFTTILMYPDKGSYEFGLYEQNEKGSLISYTKDGGNLNIKCTDTKRQLLFRVFDDNTVTGITSQNGSLQRAYSVEELISMDLGYFEDADGILWIAVKNAVNGLDLEVF